MTTLFSRTISLVAIHLAFCLVLGACSADLSLPDSKPDSATLNFGSEQRLGHNEKNPAAPFLRYSPDGRLFAVWTEDHDTPWPQGNQPAKHQHGSGDRAPSPMRNVLLAWSADGGKTWSSPVQVNSAVEAVQGEENGPKVA